MIPERRRSARTGVDADIWRMPQAELQQRDPANRTNKLSTILFNFSVFAVHAP
jgi:hypothetical protein